MTILADHQIHELVRSSNMITPFQDTLVQEGVVSYGLSSFGYDVRLGTGFARWGQCAGAALDPLRVDPDNDAHHFSASRPFVIEPREFLLAHTVEVIRLPPWVTGYVKDKSTLARCGVCLQNTVLEAGWEGQITLEIYNYLDRPVVLRPGEGIAQVVFHAGADSCSVPYETRGGKYQGQRGVTLPRVKLKDPSQVQFLVRRGGPSPRSSLSDQP